MDTDHRLGPAMTALNPRQRAFVFSLIEIGGQPVERAAAMAGYQGSPATLRVTGTRLAHDAQIQEALVEEARFILHSSSVLAVSKLHEMLYDPTVGASTRLRAIELVLNRVGMPSNQIHEVKHTVTITEQEQVNKVVELAKRLGVEPQRLLGIAGVTTDADFTIVGSTEDWDKDE